MKLRILIEKVELKGSSILELSPGQREVALVVLRKKWMVASDFLYLKIIFQVLIIFESCLRVFSDPSQDYQFSKRVRSFVKMEIDLFPVLDSLMKTAAISSSPTLVLRRRNTACFVLFLSFSIQYASLNNS